MRVLAPVAAVLVLAACAAPQSQPAAEPPGVGSASVAGTETAAPSAVPSFTFAAAGDLGANSHTAAGLDALDASDAAFFLALGDLDYDQTPSDEAWCEYVRDGLQTKGESFPFQILAGNHEADNGPDGWVMNHAACLPDRLSSEGKYPAQYAFGYPTDAPIARFVMVSPRLTVDGHTYDYTSGTEDRAWLVDQVRKAKRAGQWVVVGMHYMCISAGSGHPGCDSGRAVHNLVLRLGADLLVVGHNHVYERSKQIKLSRACPRVGRRYDADCVTDGGRDGAYSRGRGTVQVTAGRFGGRPMTINSDDPDRRWFRKAGGGTTGFLQVTVTEKQLDARYVPTSGVVRDAFTIG